MHLLDRNVRLERFETFDVGALVDGLPVVLEGLWDDPTHARIRAGGARLLDSPEAIPAGVGREGVRDTTVRGDSTRWIEPENVDVALEPLLVMFHALGSHLSQAAYLGLRRFELQLAGYREGAFYARHRDAFRGSGGRRVTAIYYPNDPWQPGDGGELAVWTPQGEKRIETVAGRLV